MRPRRAWLKSMIVMAIVAVLMSAAIPIYSHTLRRSKESMLKNNLLVLRTVIQEYTNDKQKAPETLGNLVSSGYLREVPLDPMTGMPNWKVAVVDQTEPRILGVKSGSDKISMEGTRYSVW